MQRPWYLTAGGDAAAVQAALDTFRTNVGDPVNGNAPGPLAGGRREINWDGGGGNPNSALAGTPFTGFENTRGATFTTPGTGFIQATPDGLAAEFTEASYATAFTAFSPLRLFNPLGSNLTEVTFSIPGTGGSEAAGVGAFGAVFNSVDLADTTSLAFFDPFDTLIETLFAPVGQFSFVGLQLDPGQQIGRILITTGNAALGASVLDDSSLGVDVVTMDDFIYQEPAPWFPSPPRWC